METRQEVMVLLPWSATVIISLIKAAGTGTEACTVVPFRSEKLLSMILRKILSIGYLSRYSDMLQVLYATNNVASLTLEFRECPKSETE